MKNFKKTISLILAICMIASLAISASAANTVDASGGTGTSSVTLSSTADGSIGGDGYSDLRAVFAGPGGEETVLSWLWDAESGEFVFRTNNKG